VTLAPKGLLIEEQRVNLLLNTAVLGTQVVTVTAAAHTLSFYGTGTIVLSGAFVGTVTGTGAYPTRTTLTFTPIVGVLTVTVTGSVEMAQLEAGSFATSYIPSVASQVTRAADNASMIGNNFARWYNVNEGTVYADVRMQTGGGIVFGDTFSNYYEPLRNNQFSAGIYGTLGGVALPTTLYTTTGSAAYPAGQYVSNQRQTFAAAIKTNDQAGGYSGNIATNTSTVNPTAAAFSGFYFGGSIGPSSSFKYNGTIARIAYFSRRLANAEIQSITA
jgi:hypothetical protein